MPSLAAHYSVTHGYAPRPTRSTSMPAAARYAFPGREQICRVCGRPAPPSTARRDDLRVCTLPNCRQEARPLELVAMCVVGLRKYLKEVGLIFWTNTGIGYAHLDEPLVVMLVLAQNKSYISVIGEFDRVVQEIDQDLTERARVKRQVLLPPTIIKLAG